MSCCRWESGLQQYVIEDDPDVCELTIRIVKGLNYRVVGKEDAVSALAYLEAGNEVDLVLSDVVLPGGLSGPQFARERRMRDPGLRVVFVSGYPAYPSTSRWVVSEITI